MTTQTHFVSFGNARFKESRARIAAEASALGVFDRITVYTEDHLQADPVFWGTFRDYMSKFPRGYGYYVWKPYLVHTYMANHMAEGDVLVYADAGCHFYPEHLARLRDYFAYVRECKTGVLGFRLEAPMSHWTRADIFQLFKQDAAFAAQPQVCATAFVVRKCKASVKMIQEWMHCIFKYPLYFTDLPSTVPNYPGFQENRYDQSFFSILCYLHGAASIEDETYPVGRGPIGANRIRI